MDIARRFTNANSSDDRSEPVTQLQVRVQITPILLSRMPMFSSRSPNTPAPTGLALAPQLADAIDSSQIRVCLKIPSSYRETPILSRLITEYGLVVNITGALLEENPKGDGCFDLELRGSVYRIRQGLAFLESLEVTIIGKPGTSGDGWHC